MRFAKTVALLLAMCTTGASSAAPVYLSCTTTFNGKRTATIEVTADEENQQITYVIVETGLSRKLTGIFTADKVRFVSNPGDLTESQYEIDRTTLRISRSLPDMKAVTGSDEGDSGTCVIVEATKNRKF